MYKLNTNRSLFVSIRDFPRPRFILIGGLISEGKTFLQSSATLQNNKETIEKSYIKNNNAKTVIYSSGVWSKICAVKKIFSELHIFLKISLKNRLQFDYLVGL